MMPRFVGYCLVLLSFFATAFAAPDEEVVTLQVAPDATLRGL